MQNKSLLPVSDKNRQIRKCFLCGGFWLKHYILLFFCIRLYIRLLRQILPFIKSEVSFPLNPPCCAWQHVFFSPAIDFQCEARVLSDVIDDSLTSGQTLQSSHVTWLQQVAIQCHLLVTDWTSCEKTLFSEAHSSACVHTNAVSYILDIGTKTRRIIMIFTNYYDLAESILNLQHVGEKAWPVVVVHCLLTRHKVFATVLQVRTWHSDSFEVLNDYSCRIWNGHGWVYRLKMRNPIE